MSNILNKTGRVLTTLVLAGSLIAAGLVAMNRDMPMTTPTYVTMSAKVVGMHVGSSKYPNGTGWIVGEDLVMTNAHIAEAADDRALSVSFKNGDKEEGKVLWKTDVNLPGLDLALVKVETGERPAADFVCEKPDAGDPVTMIGMPRSTSLWHMSKGYIATEHPAAGNEDNARDYISMDIAVEPGNSGSPIFNEDGKVVGVLNSGKAIAAGYSRVTTNIVWAVSGPALCETLAR